MKVKAAPGLLVPKENRPRSYISDKRFETVPDTAYYLRLAACADLIVARHTGNGKPKPAPTEKRAAKVTTIKGSK